MDVPLELIGDSRIGRVFPVLDLQPMRLPSAAVGSIPPLRNQTFQTHPARCPKQARPDLALFEWRHEDCQKANPPKFAQRGESGN
jgi:hypothetical protein